MGFEVGKYYKHNNPRVPQLHVLGVVTGSVYHMGPMVFIAEQFGNGNVVPVGSDEVSAENWEECAPWVVKPELGNVYVAKEGINDDCTHSGCPSCGGSGLVSGHRSTCLG